jgi:hypothetical protein
MQRTIGNVDANDKDAAATAGIFCLCFMYVSTIRLGIPNPPYWEWCQSACMNFRCAGGIFLEESSRSWRNIVNMLTLVQRPGKEIQQRSRMD